METEKPHCDILSEKEFIASPAEIDAHRKVKLQDVEVLNIDKNKYKEAMLQTEGMENEKPHCDISSEKKFITSPADLDTHRKVKLQDAEVLDKYKKEFEKLCEEYNDIFSKDSSDIGKTPLITMEIETGDSPPVCQRSYNLPLKHIDCVLLGLKGSKVNSGFDAQSGYHHMGLSAKARPKSAFVTPTDKYEFTRCFLD